MKRLFGMLSIVSIISTSSLAISCSKVEYEEVIKSKKKVVDNPFIDWINRKQETNLVRKTILKDVVLYIMQNNTHTEWVEITKSIAEHSKEFINKTIDYEGMSYKIENVEANFKELEITYNFTLPSKLTKKIKVSDVLDNIVYIDNIYSKDKPVIIYDSQSKNTDIKQVFVDNQVFSEEISEQISVIAKTDINFTYDINNAPNHSKNNIDVNDADLELNIAENANKILSTKKKYDFKVNFKNYQPLIYEYIKYLSSDIPNKTRYLESANIAKIGLHRNNRIWLESVFMPFNGFTDIPKQITMYKNEEIIKAKKFDKLNETYNIFETACWGLKHKDLYNPTGAKESGWWLNDDQAIQSGPQAIIRDILDAGLVPESQREFSYRFNDNKDSGTTYVMSNIPKFRNDVTSDYVMVEILGIKGTYEGWKQQLKWYFKDIYKVAKNLWINHKDYDKSAYKANWKAAENCGWDA